MNGRRVYRLRDAIPVSLVALLRRGVDVSGGVRDEMTWRRLRSILVDSIESGRGAVVVHLHYPDRLPALVKSLRDNVPSAFPIVVTVTDSTVHTEVLRQLPRAVVVTVPNRGRDVLPFLEVSHALKSIGFVWVLKLHGKKSAFHSYGDEWFHASIESLLPNREVAGDCIQAVTKGKTLIGPKGFYYRLDTRWEPNAKNVERVTGPLIPEKLGFFGGTMWWMSLELLDQLPRWRSWDFPRERGQTDGTRAHAFERLICVQPQLKGWRVAIVDVNGVREPIEFDPFPHDKL